MTALLLDTSSLFYRAHHALPPMNTAAGEPTAAIYGLSVLLLKLLREEKPDGVAFARDLPGPTFRHRAYRDYKAGRAAMPEAMRTQWARLEQLIEATGVPSHAAPGLEADDVLATLARRLVLDGQRVVIVSGDRDLFQTIAPEVRVLFVGARGQKPELVDAAVIRARYGVNPRQMPTWSAIVGESADNLIGVDGVGAKTASKLVSAHGTGERLFAELEAITPLKVREALRGAQARVLENERLATLVDDAPLGAGPLIAPLDAAARTRMGAFFAELEFKSLVSRLEALAPATGAGSEHPGR